MSLISSLEYVVIGSMSIFLLCLGRCLVWVSKIASFSDSDNKSNALLMENTSLINSIPRYRFAFSNDFALFSLNFLIHFLRKQLINSFLDFKIDITNSCTSTFTTAFKGKAHFSHFSCSPNYSTYFRILQ